MAITEISKIQIRRGYENQTGIPQLDTGEMGWAIDTEQLVIGNLSTDGAPETKNVRILTENDIPNIFNITSSSYVYYQLRNDPSVGNTVVRTIQDKLDDLANVADFGADNSGTVYTHVQLQHAIDEIFLNDDKATPHNRKILNLPSGIFLVNQTVYVPPYTTLVGAGYGKTVIKTSSTNAVLQFCDQTSTPGSYVVFVDGASNLTSNGRPTNIHLEGITFEYDSSVDPTALTAPSPLIYADGAANSAIVNCEFLGHYTATVATYVGIDIRGQGVITSEGLQLVGNKFSHLNAGIKSNYDTKDTIIERNQFTHLYHGIAYAKSLASSNTTGPTRSKIYSNTFYDISKEGIYVAANTSGSPTNHSSFKNTFDNVGNNSLGDLNQSTAVIYWGSAGNRSEDYFERFQTVNSTSTSVTFKPLVQGHVYYEDFGVQSTTIAVAASPLVFSKVPWAGTDQVLKLRYIIDKSSANISRRGEVTVSVGLGTSAAVTDSFTYQGPNDGGLTFHASLNTSTNVVALAYTSTNAVGTIQYQYSSFQ